MSHQYVDELLVDLRALRRGIESGRSTAVRTESVTEAGARPAAPATSETATGTPADHTAPLQTEAEAIDRPSPGRHQPILLALFSVTLLALLALGYVHFQEAPPEAPLRRFSLRFPPSIKPAMTALRLMPFDIKVDKPLYSCPTNTCLQAHSKFSRST